MNIIVDQQAVLQLLRQHNTDKLSSDLASEGDPGMIDTVLLAHVFGVIQRYRRISIGNNEDLVGSEDLESMLNRP